MVADTKKPPSSGRRVKTDRNQPTFFGCVQVCCTVPLRSDVGLLGLKGAAYLMSSPMVALVGRELVMLTYNQRLNERGAVS